jgi:hypothetical protein
LKPARQTERRYLGRRVMTWLDDDGMVVIRGRLTPEAGAVVQRALEAAADQLRQESAWLKEVRRQNPAPVKRLRLAHPKVPGTPVLRDMQHALAREHGYENWKALKSAIERRDMPAVPNLPDVRSIETHSDRVALFLVFA